jgi:hypothetical protein
VATGAAPGAIRLLCFAAGSRDELHKVSGKRRDDEGRRQMETQVEIFVASGIGLPQVVVLHERPEGIDDDVLEKLAGGVISITDIEEE